MLKQALLAEENCIIWIHSNSVETSEVQIHVNNLLLGKFGWLVGLVVVVVFTFLLWM